MNISPLAGKPAPEGQLVDIPALITAYYTESPDPGVAAQRVAFGTSGHRGGMGVLSRMDAESPDDGGSGWPTTRMVRSFGPVGANTGSPGMAHSAFWLRVKPSAGSERLPAERADNESGRDARAPRRSGW